MVADGQTFHHHVNELRRRLVWVIAAIFISAGIAYGLRDRVIVWLQRPLGKTLYYTSPTGSFNFVLKIAMVVGIFVALPVAIYHLMRFIEPALPKRISSKMILATLSASFLLAFAGVVFGYYIMIPMSLKFFGGFSTAQVQPWISADQYLTYMINNLLIFALIFQIPLFTLFINRIKPLKPSQLLKYQRHVVVGAFAIALILPFTYDPITQFITALPIIVLYYMSVLFVAVSNARRGRKQRKQKISPDIIEPKNPDPDQAPELAAQPAEEEEAPKRQFVPVPSFLLPAVMPINETIARTVDGFGFNSRPTVTLSAPRPHAPKPIQNTESTDSMRIDGFFPPKTASA